jgi:hypothetical protein
LLFPTVSASPHKEPTKTFEVAVVTFAPAKYPTAVLRESVAEVKFWLDNAALPIAVDLLP